MPAIVVYGAYAAGSALAAGAVTGISALAAGASVVAGAAYVAGSIKGGDEGQKWRNGAIELSTAATAVTAFAPAIESGLSKVGLSKVGVEVGKNAAKTGAETAATTAATTASDIGGAAASDAQMMGVTPTAGPLAAPSAPVSGLNQASNITGNLGLNQAGNLTEGATGIAGKTGGGLITANPLAMTDYQKAYIDQLDKSRTLQQQGIALDVAGKYVAGSALEDQAKWQNEQQRIAADKLAQERTQNNRLAYMTQGNVKWR